MNTSPQKLLLLAALALTTGIACGEEGAPDSTGGEGYNAGPVSRAFNAAALEFELDVDLLKSVGYVESRFDMRDGQPSLDGGYGVMHLVEREDRDMVSEAAEILGVTPQAIRSDLATNIRAGAALLRLYAEQQAHDPIDLRDAPAEAYRDAVARYAGDVDPEVVASYVEQVFSTYYDGAGLTVAGEPVEIPGAGVPRDVTDAIEAGLYGSSTQGLGDSASVDRWVPASSSNYSGGRGGNRVRMVVVHTTQGSYAGAISWFQNPRAQVSAHYVVRSSDGQVTQMVRESDTGWHARDANRYSVGIEHEGFVDNSAWYTEAMYRASARLTCEIAQRHGLPVDRQHVVGHVEVPGNSHTDPGRYWDWAHYMSLVRACAPAGSGGGGSSSGGSSSGGSSVGGSGGGSSSGALLQGVIYQGSNTDARISGARVTAAGQTATTNGNGYYSLRVPAGQVSISASKSGYASKTIRRNAVRGADNWGSMGLTRGTGSSSSGASGSGGGSSAGAGTQEANANATLIGVVYQRPDTSARISGATVRLSTGASVTTGSDGVYRFRVVRGRSYRVTASKGGYTTNLVSRTVSENESWASVGLARSAGTGVLRGVVFESPELSRRLGGARVTLEGGQTAITAADGSYSFRVAAGSHTVTATKAGYAPRLLSRTVTSNTTTWGSLGLRKLRREVSGGSGGGGGSGGSNGGGIPTELAPMIISPRDGAVVGGDPEFRFRAPERSRTERTVYQLIVASMTDALAEPREFELEEAAGAMDLARRVGANLPPDRYAWAVVAIYPDSNGQSEMPDAEEFQVR